VEDGEPVSVFYDEEADIKKKEINKEVIKQTEESQNKSTDVHESSKEKPENNVPKVKTKWDFDGSLK
jgi:uncharacterized protein (DUF2225 family)